MSDLFASLTPARPAAAPSKGSDFATFKNRPAIATPEPPAPCAYPEELCAVCGRFGAFGFDRQKNRSAQERYACAAHRAEVERMWARESP